MSWDAIEGCFMFIGCAIFAGGAAIGVVVCLWLFT